MTNIGSRNVKLAAAIYADHAHGAKTFRLSEGSPTNAGSQPELAVTILVGTGQSVATIASELGVHVSTVYRWRSGARRPSVANHAALKRLVFDLQARELAKVRVWAPAVIAYRRILANLETNADRAASAELIARMNADLDLSYAQPHANRTASVDPFELVRRSTTQMEIPF
jgi:transposase